MRKPRGPQLPKCPRARRYNWTGYRKPAVVVAIAAIAVSAIFATIELLSVSPSPQVVLGEEIEAVIEERISAVLRARVAQPEDSDVLRSAYERLARSKIEAGLTTDEILADLRNRSMGELTSFLQHEIEHSESELTELHRELAATAYVGGDLATAARSLHVILALQPSDFGSVLRLGGIAQRLGDLDAAEDRYDFVLDNATSEVWRSKSLGNLGTIARLRGKYDESISLHRESLEIDRKLGRREGEARNLANMGITFWSSGNQEQAQSHLSDAKAIFEALGDVEGQAACFHGLANVAISKHEPEIAMQYLRESLELHRQHDNEEGRAAALNGMANVAKIQSQFDEATRLYSESKNIYREMGDLNGQARNLIGLGEIAEILGDHDEARSFWSEAYGIYFGMGLEQIAAGLEDRINLLSAR